MKKVVLNFKMNLTLEEAKSYATEFEKIVPENAKIIVCPSFPFLYLFLSDKYALGAQEVCEYIEGSYTGEISAKQLASLGCKYTIINHSERKKFRNESDMVLIDKIRNAINNHINVILCLGETQEEKNNGKTDFVITNKISSIFNKLNKQEIESVTIAYEPVWAIGTGLTPTNQEIDHVSDLIKKTVSSNYDTGIDVLYGGSINGYNITTLVNCLSIDGFLVGKSSLNINEVNNILQMVQKSDDIN